MISVNDFPNCLRSSQGNMFADDTICYAQGTTTEVQNDLQFDVCNASKWYKHNKLSLNIEKSGCICYFEHVKRFIIIHIWQLS